MQGLAGILLHEQDGALFTLKIHNGAKNFLHQHWSQTERRLIQHKQLRAGHQSPTNGQHLLFTTAERGAKLLAAVTQDGELVEDDLHIVPYLGPVRTSIGAHFEILLHRHAGQNAPALLHLQDSQTHDFIFGHAVQTPSLKEHVPTTWPQDA